ncbi:hypothetical protein CROQUDRAFT_663799 [Cronartium quercuum f. sp. fusiforme G11]|uniref:HSA domain-containing protein n=1 Tax=Cronartium quercuum f. sp. fusiforme G11 TaxID=708437 RepID=A0A9P6N7T7_9BASI|nr:hypothetical protein CROQUDRAFT_663799 [Cronartium quercuum f. sp. fusiforme G11]
MRRDHHSYPSHFGLATSPTINMPSGAQLRSPSQTRALLLQIKNEQILASKESYRQLLSELFAAIEDIAHFSELGAGQRHRTISPASDRQTRLHTFVEKFTIGGHSISELNLSIPMESPPSIDRDILEDLTPPMSVSMKENSSAEAVPMDVDDVVDQSKLIPELEELSPDEDLSTTQEITLETPFASHIAPSGGDDVPSLDEPNSFAETIPESSGTDGLSEPPNPVNSSRAFPSQPIRLSAINPNILMLSPRKAPPTRMSSLFFDGASQSPRPNNCVSEDYVNNLPPIPAPIVNTRLFAAQPLPGSNSQHWRRQAARAGVWVGPGSNGPGTNELVKMSIKTQHVGVKAALGISDHSKEKHQPESARFKNVLTSADWKTMFEELKMARALEAIERKKAERTWAYTQVRKSRVVQITKAHWDHLLDEMSWLQIDFRQERRWKIATAYRLAHEVAKWHLADASGRKALQFTYDVNAVNQDAVEQDVVDQNVVDQEALDQNDLDHNASNQLAIDQNVGPKAINQNVVEQKATDPTVAEQEAINQNADAQNIVDKNVEPSPPFIDGPNQMPDPTDISNIFVGLTEDTSPYASSKNSPETSRSMKSLKGLRTSDPNLSGQPRKSALSSEARALLHAESRKAHQRKTLARMAIFNILPHQTTIELDQTLPAEVFSTSSGHVVERSPLHQIFNDLPLFGDLESLSTKRPDETSPYIGRITRIAKHIESKPLLVSSLKPSRNCVGQKWSNLSAWSAEDLRERPEGRTEAVPIPSHLFSGRKYRESKDYNALAASSLASETKERKEPWVWTEADEERLKSLRASYNSNWNIVADVFNATSSGSSVHRLTPRDCHECWTRLESQSKSAVEADPPASESSLGPPPPPVSESSLGPPPPPVSESSLGPPPPAVSEPSLGPPPPPVSESSLGPPAPSVSESSLGLPPENTPANPTQAGESVQQEISTETGDKRPSTFASPPAKRVSRQAAIYEISQRVKEKRAAEAPKPLPPGQPRQISLNAHETHAQAMRPYMTPLEMSALKADRDRQAQATLEMVKRQHQMQSESLIHQARAAAVASLMPMRNGGAMNGASAVNGNMSARIVSQSPVPQSRNGNTSGAVPNRPTNIALRYGMGAVPGANPGGASPPNTIAVPPLAAAAHLLNASQNANLPRNLTSHQIAQYLQQQHQLQQQQQQHLDQQLHSAATGAQMQNQIPQLQHLHQQVQAQAQLQQQHAAQLHFQNSQQSQQNTHVPTTPMASSPPRPPSAPTGGT